MTAVKLSAAQRAALARCVQHETRGQTSGPWRRYESKPTWRALERLGFVRRVGTELAGALASYRITDAGRAALAYDDA